MPSVGGRCHYFAVGTAIYESRGKPDTVIGTDINAKLGATIPFTCASESEGKLISLIVILTVANVYPWTGSLHADGLREVIDPCRCCILADKVTFLKASLPKLSNF